MGSNFNATQNARLLVRGVNETDATLAELVADDRAATPTAVPEYATPNLADVLTKIVQLRASSLCGNAG